MMDANLLNGLSLAYIGDAYYELLIRNHFINEGYMKVNDLHKHVINYTSGLAQSKFIHYFLENNILSDEEIKIFKRGRNSHVHTSRKNLELKDYLDATGFEALFGYLFLNNNFKRIDELMELIYKL